VRAVDLVRCSVTEYILLTASDILTRSSIVDTCSLEGDIDHVPLLLLTCLLMSFRGSLT